MESLRHVVQFPHGAQVLQEAVHEVRVIDRGERLEESVDLFVPEAVGHRRGSFARA
jgi:hypothetical protein